MAPESLNSFTKGLKRLIEDVTPQIKPRRVKLLVTGRPIAVLETELYCPSISVRSERDVRHFVQGKANELARRYASSPDLKNGIVEKICEKAKGMFLYAIFIMA